VPECGNAKLFEVLGGEAREDPLVILLSRNASSYSSRPRLRSQTTMSMTGAPQSWVVHIICRGSEGVQGGVGVLRGSQSPLRSKRNGRSLTLL
jgi:hypothetical protein